MQVIKYEDLIDVADEAKNWYAGQGDPIYALVSSVYAGRDVPLDVAEDALRNLESDYRKTTNNEDRDALGDAITELAFKINEVRTRAMYLPNPVVKPEVIARRKTYDNIDVAIWSDGGVSNRTGSILLRGRVPKDSIWVFANNVSLYDWDELEKFIVWMKRTKRNPIPAEFRSTMHTRVSRPPSTNILEHPAELGLAIFGGTALIYAVYVIVKGSLPAVVVNSQPAPVPYGT